MINILDFLAGKRVLLGFVYAGIIVIFANPTPDSLVTGILLGIFGELIRTWSAGYIEKMDRIITAGPFAYARNPLYIGSFVMGFGFCVAGHNIIVLIVYIVLFAATYTRLVFREEKELLAGFGKVYEDYCNAVPRFFPRILSRIERTGQFTFKRIFINKEHYSWIGFIFIAIVLFLKWRFLY